MKRKYISTFVAIFMGTAFATMTAHAGGFVDLRTGTQQQLCASSGETGAKTLRCFTLTNPSTDPLYLAPTIQGNTVSFPSSLTLINKTDTSFTSALDASFTGVFSDYIFMDKTTNTVVIGSRLYFPPVNNLTNKSEVNDIFRYGFDGFNVQAAWTILDPNDKALISVALTDRGLKQVDKINTNVVDFRTDVNASESKPTSGLYLARTNATAFKVINNAINLRQGGEEGQNVLSVQLAGYAPTKLDSDVGANDTIKVYGGTYTSNTNVAGKVSVETGNAQFNGNIAAANGSEIKVTSGSTATFNGAFNQQVGAVLDGGGSFVFNGGYAPGNSPGAVTIVGDVTFGNLNIATFEIGGTTLGAQYDHLSVNGALAFGGTLNVVWYNGFTAAAGQTFDLFNFTSSTGSFSTLNLATLSSGLTWNTTNLYTNGSISVESATPVPEPTNLALMTLGLGLLGSIARRKRK